MLSRIAESLFWIGRYVERADDTARILDAFLARLLEDEGFSRLHVFRYSVRPGTPAERLPRHVDGRVKSVRAIPGPCPEQ